MDLGACRERIVSELERCKTNLRPLESGKVRIYSKTAGEELRDISGEEINRLRQTIVAFEIILANLGRPTAGEDVAF